MSDELPLAAASRRLRDTPGFPRRPGRPRKHAVDGHVYGQAAGGVPQPRAAAIKNERADGARVCQTRAMAPEPCRRGKHPSVSITDEPWQAHGDSRMNDGPLTEASARLRRPSGRPRRVTVTPTIGSDIQGAGPKAASTAVIVADFAPALPARGLTLKVAAAYSGLPVRRLWVYISSGVLQPIRPPGCRRVLIDRLDLDRLLETWKQA